MDETPFREYREYLVRDYAQDKVRSGAWSKAEAEDKSANAVDGLLPEGPATRGHFLYSVRDESVPAEVGVLWISPRDSGAGRLSGSTTSSSTSTSAAKATQVASWNWSKTRPEN
jgi:hypothetical protein